MAAKNTLLALPSNASVVELAFCFAYVHRSLQKRDSLPLWALMEKIVDLACGLRTDAGDLGEIAQCRALNRF
jgi:hypothetical protein